MALLRDGGADRSFPSLWYRVTRSGGPLGVVGTEGLAHRRLSSPDATFPIILPTPPHLVSGLPPGRPARIAKTGAFVGLMTKWGASEAIRGPICPAWGRHVDSEQLYAPRTSTRGASLPPVTRPPGSGPSVCGNVPLSRSGSPPGPARPRARRGRRRILPVCC